MAAIAASRGKGMDRAAGRWCGWARCVVTVADAALRKPTEGGKRWMNWVVGIGEPCNPAAKRPESRDTLKSGREEQTPPATQFAKSMTLQVRV